MSQAGKVSNSIGGPSVIIKTQRVKVALDGVDGVVDDDLLKSRITSVVLVDSRGLIRIGDAQATCE